MPPYQIQPVTTLDSPGISTAWMTALWSWNHWTLMWLEKNHDLPYLIRGCTARLPHIMTRDRVTRRYQKVVDISTGEIVGYCRWILPQGYEQSWPEARCPDPTDEEAARYKKAWEESDWEYGTKLDRFDPPIEQARETMRKEVFKGESYMTLDSLSVLPSHKGKGIATSLVQSGIRIADELNLPCEVTATAAGLGVYLRAGFQVYEKIVQDDSKEGGDGRCTMVAGYRLPGGGKEREEGEVKKIEEEVGK